MEFYRVHGVDEPANEQMNPKRWRFNGARTADATTTTVDNMLMSDSDDVRDSQ